MAPSSFRIKKFGVLSIAKFCGTVGLVWGFLSGVILLASYIQGYLANNEASLIQSGLLGFGLMILYGVIGGVIGGALLAVAYNRLLGAAHGIDMVLDAQP
jgi:hypothetical protein